MNTIVAHIIDRFQGGDRLVQVVSEPGITKVRTKEGEIDLPFKPGDVALTRGDGSVICGPIGFEAALDYAERVLEGDQRANTDPVGRQMLAAVVVAISSVQPSEPPPPAVEAAATAVA